MALLSLAFTGRFFVVVEFVIVVCLLCLGEIVCKVPHLLLQCHLLLKVHIISAFQLFKLISRFLSEVILHGLKFGHLLFDNFYLRVENESLSLDLQRAL